jgi:hypothetical protein
MAEKIPCNTTFIFVQSPKSWSSADQHEIGIIRFRLGVWAIKISAGGVAWEEVDQISSVTAARVNVIFKGEPASL